MSNKIEKDLEAILEQNARYEFHQVNSSAISRIGWDKQEEKMIVQFKGSPLYVYPVQKEVYEEFKKSESKGRFFQKYIKDNYTFERLDN